MRNILAIILVALILLSGCTEEEKAAQKEFWFGEPNIERELSFLDSEPSDSQYIKSVKGILKKNTLEGYSKLGSVHARKRFLEVAIPSMSNELSIARMQDRGVISERDAAIMSYNARRENEIMLRNEQLVDRLR